MSDIKYIIHRYELYGNPPVGKLVGFLVKNEQTEKSEYCETIVYNTEVVKTDAEICQDAYDQLFDHIEQLTSLVSASSSLIGSEFIP